MTSPTPVRTLIVIGTPIAGSLNHALADAYAAAARAGGADVRVIDLAVDPIPAHPTSRGDLRVTRTDAGRTVFTAVLPQTSPAPRPEEVAP